MGFEANWNDLLPIIRTVSKLHVWRTIYLSIDQEDLEQEAYFVFYKCLNKDYEYENKTHFISLFKIAFLNRITDIIKNKRLEKEAVVRFTEETNEEFDYLEIYFKSGDKTDFHTKYMEAPEEIRQIITLLNYRGLVNLNRITNKKLCELLGYNPNKRNLLKEIKQYFKGE